jgi:hypothetical protein
MYLRVTTVRRGPKTYHYAQIVESYRKDGGSPTNRIIASLGQRSEAEIAAIRAALEIARTGGTPVVDAKLLAQVQVLHSLRYLDAAVLLAAWRNFGLQSLLVDVLGSSKTEVSTADVVVALVLQRCLAPASKLAASRWFPTTALPELLGIIPKQFNNSRVHRVLTSLEAAEAKLQHRLPGHLRKTHGAASLLFIDATDTWFEGHGPPLAAKGKDKEGLFRRRVGIVLLCDERGFPLRWHTLDGRYHDPTALGDMAREIAQLPWAIDVPVVVDRALGNAGWVEKLDTLKLRYITCVPAPELESCGAPIPWETIDDMHACGDDLKALQDKAVAAGFHHDGDEHYVCELGLFDKSRPQNSTRISAARSALNIMEMLEDATEKNNVLASRLRISTRSLPRYRKLSSLDPSVRKRIARGDADALSISQLQQIATLPAKRQLATLDALLKAAPVGQRRARQSQVEQRPPLQARAALSLNPVRLIEDRQAEENHLDSIRRLVEDVNRRLASPRSRRTDASALAEVEHLIRKCKLGNVCSTTMRRTGNSRRVLLHIDEAAWRQRRRSDGISLIISHPDVPGSASERVARYFSKDAVEKDFQSIKSLLGIRPIRHRTDPKLRAHVSICMLALLLSRLVEHQLETRGNQHTLAAIIESLEPIRLNLINDGNNRYYTVTQPNETAKEILSALGMAELIDNVTITEGITPR